MTNIQKIQAIICDKKPEDALIIINEELKSEPENPQLLFLRGKLHWRMGSRAKAISDYEHSVQLDPSSPARLALEMARDVMNYFNPDLLNP